MSIIKTGRFNQLSQAKTKQSMYLEYAKRLRLCVI